MVTSSAMPRQEELAANLRAVEERLAAACAAAGRDRHEVTLVAVTKAFPVTDIRLLASLGVSDIAENRDQEAAPKARQCADLDLTWHFVGQLQTNKCRSVAGYAHVVHSIDRSRLVGVLGQETRRAGRTLSCLVQVNLDGEETQRAGVEPRAALRLADEVASEEGLFLAGVMAVAPQHDDPEAVFARFAEVAASIRSVYPQATAISAGMTGDLECAVAHGATHVRIGTALLGARQEVVR